MSGVELVIGGVVVVAVAGTVLRARSGARRARMAADIAQVGTSPVSLIGRVLVTASVIVGVQWWVITHTPTGIAWWVALGIPALVTAVVLVKATTVTQIGPSPRRRSGGGQR